MSLRCGCPAEGDEIVFGPVHECTAPKPALPAEQPWETTLGPDDLDPGEG